jgi:predicted nuclease of predicted toxin-antitoxin system
VRLLLNEQINPHAAVVLRARGCDVVTADDLGTRGATDEEQLSAAVRNRRTLVTYNIADFAVLAGEWARRGLTHWGIVLVSERTVSQRSVGDLARALERLVMEFPGEGALVDQVLFLTRGEEQEAP